MTNKTYKIIGNNLSVFEVSASNAKQAAHIAYMSFSDPECLSEDNVTIDTVDYFDPVYNEENDIAKIGNDDFWILAVEA